MASTKTTAPLDVLEGKDFSMFAGKNVCVSGKKFVRFSTNDLKAVLKAAGANLSASPTKKTDIMFSGYDWTRKVRDALHKGAEVWSEGQLMLALEGRSDFPQAEDVPCGEVLSRLKRGRLSETRFNSPDGYTGELVLKWKKVKFTIHRRFAELFGFQLHGSDFESYGIQYWGNFFYNGEALTLANLSGDGAEYWVNFRCWEDGSDTDECIEVIGRGEGEETGFNCSFLPSCQRNQKKAEVTWARTQGSVFKADFSIFNFPRSFGDVQTIHGDNHLFIDLDERRCSRTTVVGHNAVDPGNAYYA